MASFTAGEANVPSGSQVQTYWLDGTSTTQSVTGLITNPISEGLKASYTRDSSTSGASVLGGEVDKYWSMDAQSIQEVVGIMPVVGVYTSTSNRRGYSGNSKNPQGGSPVNITWKLDATGMVNVEGMGPGSFTANGSLVPTAYFRRVAGVITDKQGNIIRNARYVVSLDNFGIVGEVDDSGVFEIYLLRQTYSDFMIVVDEGKKEGVDMVWYESEGTEVSIYDGSKQLTFDTSQTLSGGGGGLQVGGGVNLG